MLKMKSKKVVKKKPVKRRFVSKAGCVSCRGPSDKSKDSKVKKLIKLAKSGKGKKPVKKRR